MPSIHEALDALRIVEEFLVNFQGLVGIPARQKQGVSINTWALDHVPRTWLERVLTLLKKEGRMRPKDISVVYLKLGWPPPTKGKLGNAIRSALLYAKRKGLAEERAGYYYLLAGPKGGDSE